MWITDLYSIGGEKNIIDRSEWFTNEHLQGEFSFSYALSRFLSAFSFRFLPGQRKLKTHCLVRLLFSRKAGRRETVLHINKLQMGKERFRDLS